MQIGMKRLSDGAGTSLSLSQRISRAHGMLQDCEMCEWRCGVDRTRGDSAPCRLGKDTYVFNRYMSLTEEPEVRPALRIYWGGCNFRCRFCDTAPACFEATSGQRVDPTVLSIELAAAVKAGSKYISILGGEPTIHLHTLLELAEASPDPLPLAINTNLYMTPEVIDLLDGVVSLYLADFKFGNDACARRLAGVPHYFEAVTRNLLRIDGQTPMIVRHLLMPGHMACCFNPVVDWLSANLPGVRFQLYTGFVPCYRSKEDPTISRLNARSEIRQAVDYLKERNLHWDAGVDGHGTDER